MAADSTHVVKVSPRHSVTVEDDWYVDSAERWAELTDDLVNDYSAQDRIRKLLKTA